MAKSNKPFPQFEGLGLNASQEQFVYWYCHPDMAFNATRSYAQAYGTDLEKNYSTASENGSKLLRNSKVMRAIDIERKRRLSSHEELAEFVMQEWYKMAQTDITEALRIHGPIIMVKSIEDIPQHLRSCIQSIKTGANGVEVKFHDKNKALENLAKALGMFVERVQNVNKDYESLVQKVARERREKKDDNS